ncbi:MAG: imidazole glycerol phosphate synthase subunit HisH [Planctomycetes bacterium]|nr:imidazole glycerol phosphate synthase subunit HisH [Planctomycetota bacterium]
MNVAIIDYEGGNLTSVARAVSHLGFDCKITRERKEILAADKVIFPGVGAAGATMEALRRAGLVEILKNELRERNVPCLGICIGIQVLFEHSEEDDVPMLGICPGKVVKFDAATGIRVPQIGWNRVSYEDPSHPFFAGVAEGEYFYFVNSYHVLPSMSSAVLGRTTYGCTSFASVVQVDNWWATQFHLEKSGKAGLRMLANFLTQGQ